MAAINETVTASKEIENALRKYIKEYCGNVGDMLYEAVGALIKEREGENS